MERIKTRHKVLAGVAIVSLLALGYWYSRVHPSAAGKRPQALLQPAHQVRIEDFRFFSIQEGRKIISLEAASFTIEKKKIGFFRIALAHTARIADCRLVIFIEPGGKRPTQKKPTAGDSPIREFPQVNRQIRFPQLLSDTVLKDFPVPLGRVTSIGVEPILVKIMEGDSTVTKITASTAEISLKNKNIRFEGNVQVISGKKTLQAGELIFDPTEGSLLTDHSYRLTSGNDATSGNHLRTDIFLGN
jgi:hypothetical protein